MKNNVWYAVLCDAEDNDYGVGSTRKRDALRLARQYRRAGYYEAYIAVVDPSDGYCIAVIRDL